MIYEPNCLSNNLVSILCYIGVPLLIAAPFYFERVHASDLGYFPFADDLNSIMFKSFQPYAYSK